MMPVLCLSVGAQAQDTNTVDELKRKVDDLTRRLEEVENKQSKSPFSFQSGNYSLDLGLIGTFAAGTSSASDIEGGTQLGGHDPNQRGFTLQSVDSMFSGVVRPYFQASAHIAFAIDSDGETFVELEEAFAETLSLPANFQLRGGQYLTEFGQHNPVHLHGWAFVDMPLVNGRFLGPDGLRNPGARLSWTPPTPFHSDLFLSIQDSHGDGAASFRSHDGHHGDEDEDELPLAFRHAENDRGIDNLGDLLFVPRYAVSIDINESHAVTLGASAAFGPNSSGQEDGGDTDTQIYGIDFAWRWTAHSHDHNHDHGHNHDHDSQHDEQAYPFVAWETEAMLRRYEAGAFDWAEESVPLIDANTGEPAVFGRETLTDYGFYTQVLYGFRKGWVAVLRFDYLWGDEADYEKRNLIFNGQPVDSDPFRSDRWRISPNLTWLPTEFAKVRLQYNYDDRKDIGRDHSIWLQFEFVLGSHGAHKPHTADAH